MKRLLVVHVLLLAFALVGSGAPARAASEGIVVIVHPDNPVNEVSMAFLRDAYLRRSGSWRGGETVRPADLSKKSATRALFSRVVLKKTMPQLKRYWNQQIFSGKGVPPPEMDSERAMIAYVLANRGAVGYLASGSDPGGAKIVKVK